MHKRAGEVTTCRPCCSCPQRVGPPRRSHRFLPASAHAALTRLCTRVAAPLAAPCRSDRPILLPPPSSAKNQSTRKPSKNLWHLSLACSFRSRFFGCSERGDGDRRRRVGVLLFAEDSPAPQEEETVPDGGDEGEDRLRGVREEGEEGAGGHEGREHGGGGGEAEQGDGDGVRGCREGDAAGGVQDGQAGGAVALRAVRYGGAPLRPRRLRQEGARRLRAQRRRRPHRRAARPRLLHRGPLHRRLQRRKPQRLLCHVAAGAAVSLAGVSSNQCGQEDMFFSFPLAVVLPGFFGSHPLLSSL